MIAHDRRVVTSINAFVFGWGDVVCYRVFSRVGRMLRRGLRRVEHLLHLRCLVPCTTKRVSSKSAQRRVREQCVLTEKGEAGAQLREGVEQGSEFAPDIRRADQRPRGLHLRELEGEDARGGYPAVLCNDNVSWRRRMESAWARVLTPINGSRKSKSASAMCFVTITTERAARIDFSRET